MPKTRYSEEKIPSDKKKSVRWGDLGGRCVTSSWSRACIGRWSVTT